MNNQLTTKIEKVVIINDDDDDVSKLQQRLSKDVEIVNLSQIDARLSNTLEADLIILDNDANDLKESKGKVTLENILSKVNAPIIYTSFQPVLIPMEVYRTKGVTVVKTDELPAFLEKNYGIKISNPQAPTCPPHTNLIVTYNTVQNYMPGIYGDGKLIIVSYDKRASDLAKSVLTDEIRKIYNDFEWRRDRDKIKNVFIYHGISAGDLPLQIASSLGHDIRIKVNILACGCDWGKKLKFADYAYVNLFKVECGGEVTLGKIADIILGVKRPDTNYDTISIPRKIILDEAERYTL